MYDLYQVLTADGKAIVQVTTANIPLDQARSVARLMCTLLTEGKSRDYVIQIRNALINGCKVEIEGETFTVDSLHSRLLEADKATMSDPRDVD